jgi:hypothetical protein
MENAINTEKLNKTADKNTGSIWLSQNKHESTGFNNHEIARITAEIMALSQKKHGINLMTINARNYVMALINADLQTNFTSDELTAIVREKPVVADTTTKPENPITLSVLKWLQDAKRCSNPRATNYEILTKANFVTKDNVNAVTQAFETFYKPVVELPL